MNIGKPYAKHYGNDNKPNQRLNEQNSECSLALCTFVNFLAVSFADQQREMANFGVFCFPATTNFSYFYLELNAFSTCSVGASFKSNTPTEQF